MNFLNGMESLFDLNEPISKPVTHRMRLYKILLDLCLAMDAELDRCVNVQEKMPPGPPAYVSLSNPPTFASRGLFTPTARKRHRRLVF